MCPRVVRAVHLTCGAAGLKGRRVNDPFWEHGVPDNYVAIRFSLRWNNDWAAKAYGDEASRERWFSMRADLFKTWVVPSIAAQTVQVRRVFVLMDTDDWNLWARYLDLSDPFCPVFVRGGEARQRETARLIREDGVRDVVLSRLDSDDAIAPNFLEEINRSAEQATSDAPGPRPLYVVAANGFTTDLTRIQAVHYNCSPFISLYVEEYADQDIYDVEHTRILDRSPVINTTALWMQIVHGTNLLNKLHNEPRFTKDGDERVMIRGPIVSARVGWPVGFLALHDPRDATSVGGRRRTSAGGSHAQPRFHIRWRR